MSSRHFFTTTALTSFLFATLCGCSGNGQSGNSGFSSMTGAITGGRLGGGGGSGGGFTGFGGRSNSGGGTADMVGKGLGVAGGLKSMTDVGEATEPALGQSVAAATINLYRLDHNPKLVRYVTLVGLTLAASSEEPDAHWSFAVLDTPKVNAFSGPDGYIMITRGAIERMHDESELAGVLAHEISHVLNHDGLHAAQTAAEVQFISQTASTFERHVAMVEHLTDGAFDTIVKNGYSKGQEDQADANAVKLVIAAGYDPNGYLHFIQRMAEASHNRGEDLFSTHPGLDNRVARIRDQIAKLGSPKGQTLADRFAANVK